jgi:hypothetical protein
MASYSEPGSNKINVYLPKFIQIILNMDSVE